MKPKRFDFDIDDVDADGIAQAQAVAGAGNLTFNGALISGGTYTSVDGLGHQIGILSAGDDSLITFTITGTDSNNKALVETIAGSAAAPGTAETAGYFKTVTQIAASGAAAGNVSAGTVDEISSPVIRLDYRSDSAATIDADITGTINYTVQECFDDVRVDHQTAQWQAITAFSGKTADVVSTASVGATAIRFIANSYTNSAECQLYVSQPLGC